MKSLSLLPQIGIIINADDFGWCPERDRGILELFQKGCITSTTVLINGRNAINALQEARKLNLPVGLHLNLTEGKPIKTNVENNTLTKLSPYKIADKEEATMDYVFHGKYELPELIKIGKIDKEHVFKEIHAQVIIALLVDFFFFFITDFSIY